MPWFTQSSYCVRTKLCCSLTCCLRNLHVAAKLCCRDAICNIITRFKNKSTIEQVEKPTPHGLLQTITLIFSDIASIWNICAQQVVFINTSLNGFSKWKRKEWTRVPNPRHLLLQFYHLLGPRLNYQGTCSVRGFPHFRTVLVQQHPPPVS